MPRKRVELRIIKETLLQNIFFLILYFIQYRLDELVWQNKCNFILADDDTNAIDT